MGTLRSAAGTFIISRFCLKDAPTLVIVRIRRRRGVGRGGSGGGIIGRSVVAIPVGVFVVVTVRAAAAVKHESTRATMHRSSGGSAATIRLVQHAARCCRSSSVVV